MHLGVGIVTPACRLPFYWLGCIMNLLSGCRYAVRLGSAPMALLAMLVPVPCQKWAQSLWYKACRRIRKCPLHMLICWPRHHTSLLPFYLGSVLLALKDLRVAARRIATSKNLHLALSS